MAVNLTLVAAEALNEIVLRHLQNDGLASAEKWEQSFYQAFENFANSPDEELYFENELGADISKAFVDKDYIFIYQTAGSETTILNICHSSRNP